MLDINQKKCYNTNVSNKASKKTIVNGVLKMKKYFRIEFEGDKIELHTRVKSLVPRLNESMNDFILKAIEERVAKIEAKKNKVSL